MPARAKIPVAGAHCEIYRVTWFTHSHQLDNSGVGSCTAGRQEAVTTVENEDCIQRCVRWHRLVVSEKIQDARHCHRFAGFASQLESVVGVGPTVARIAYHQIVRPEALRAFECHIKQVTFRCQNCTISAKLLPSWSAFVLSSSHPKWDA